jgi:hypothetical protein
VWGAGNAKVVARIYTQGDINSIARSITNVIVAPTANVIIVPFAHLPAAAVPKLEPWPAIRSHSLLSMPIS